MELIYSVKQMFCTEDPKSCLSAYGADKYHIPAYQRGYKWKSDKTGAVQVLLDDLLENYKKDPNKEYFLQYITLKSIDRHLEVIDGQQRLTTLSILLSVAAQFLEEENLASDKLTYATRDSFFSNVIYQKAKLQSLLKQNSWKEFVSKDPAFDSQDVWHIREAAICVNKFFTKVLKKEKINPKEFLDYLLQHVKIIVNSVESHVSSETVFKNLNSNKVALTEVELIKGWFITKVGRNKVPNGANSFVEMMELRARLGRQWDEITAWTNKEDVSDFYFGSEGYGMHQFLTLVAMSLGLELKKKDKTNGLFNHFVSQDINEAYNQLQFIFRLLKDWYANNNLYHLIGFANFAKNNKIKRLDLLHELIQKESKSQLMNWLNDIKNKLINVDLDQLRYPENNDEIQTVLLYLNLFMGNTNSEFIRAEDPTDTRFNFLKFSKEQWTLEHIFPQRPFGKNQNGVEELDEVIEILGGREHLESELEESLYKEERSIDDIDLIHNALASTDELNSIGNICLLSKEDNASNGCMFFKAKRQNMLKRLQKGSFVPRHTFDVFSKMIDGIAGSDISTWKKSDINLHQNWIQTKITP